MPSRLLLDSTSGSQTAGQSVALCLSGTRISACAMGSAAGGAGGAAAPPDFGGFCSEMFELYNTVFRAERM